MVKRKACKRCKMFIEGGECPLCHSNVFSNNWQGRIFISDPNQSEIAQKIGIKAKGEYAIKVK